MDSLEQKRLQALRDLNVLDTGPSPELDRITGLASRIFGAPIALVSLVDENRQWFKSRCGLDATETPREWAFCDHAIRSTDVMEVLDAREDPRFRENPLVTGPPDIRYYCGAPLITQDGDRVGTLCIIDDKPREEAMSQGKRLLLSELAGQAIREIERLNAAEPTAAAAVGT